MDYNDYENEIEEDETNLNEKEDNQNPKKQKSKRTKIKRKTKTKIKKQKPKTKIVYKDKKSGSGFLVFFLIIIILGLLAAIGYLIYINYYNKEEVQKENEQIEETDVKICEATATKYSISSGLNKCPNENNFKLIIKGTDLSFDITRTSENKYIINDMYYKEKEVNASQIVGVSLTDDWKLKENSNITYLLVQKDNNENSQILIAIQDGNVLYQGTEAEYTLGSKITYTKYTQLGLEEINTCEYYENNNLLDSEMWTKGTLIYKDNQIIENEEETITANDVCKK